jgi:hypothetical protein
VKTDPDEFPFRQQLKTEISKHLIIFSVFSHIFSLLTSAHILFACMNLSELQWEVVLCNVYEKTENVTKKPF